MLKKSQEKAPKPASSKASEFAYLTSRSGHDDRYILLDNTHSRLKARHENAVEFKES